MIRLALAIGFLAVFGFVAYALVLLLTRAFNRKESEREEIVNQPLNKKDNEEKSH